jgi:hypothetical protein
MSDIHKEIEREITFLKKQLNIFYLLTDENGSEVDFSSEDEIIDTDPPEDL